MTLTPDALTSHATFGSGGAEPYARALRRDGRLRMLRTHGEGRDAVETAVHDDDAFDVARWSADADLADLSTLDGASSVLDVGCGPARMVRAAVGRGLRALGVDVSPVAVELAREAGIPVVAGSVFDALPHEGDWDAVLLLDGNIGIGGDPTALLARCGAVASRAGGVVVEVADEPALDDVYLARVVDDRGSASDSFPWAEVGAEALAAHARRAGLEVDQAWVVDGRTFCRLVRTR